MTTPRFMRQPDHDRRIGRGDDFAGDAWLDSATGKVVYTVVGHDPSKTRSPDGEERKMP